jgi:hypothetical protein
LDAAGQQLVDDICMHELDVASVRPAEPPLLGYENFASASLPGKGESASEPAGLQLVSKLHPRHRSRRGGQRLRCNALHRVGTHPAPGCSFDRMTLRTRTTREHPELPTRRWPLGNADVHRLCLPHESLESFFIPGLHFAHGVSLELCQKRITATDDHAPMFGYQLCHDGADNVRFRSTKLVGVVPDFGIDLVENRVARICSRLVVALGASLCSGPRTTQSRIEASSKSSP